MVPVYNLVIDITAVNIIIDEKEFREIVSPCLTYLHALKGAFDKKNCSVVFFPPDGQNESSRYWSVRCISMISVGKDRGEHLMQLYQAIVRLITLELPDFEIQAEVSKLNFS